MRTQIVPLEVETRGMVPTLKFDALDRLARRQHGLRTTAQLESLGLGADACYRLVAA